MTGANEAQDGAGKRYEQLARAVGTPGYFVFTEKFFESNDPRFDAILLLGARLTHQTGNMNILNSFNWRGFSKKARLITRFFVEKISCTYDIPSFETLQTYDYSSRYSTVGTVDHGLTYSPNLGSDGVLAEFVEHTGYDFKEYSLDHETSNGVWTTEEFSGYRVWTHVVRSPLQYEYPWLECTPPLNFTYRTSGYNAAKPAHVWWKITLGVRFHGSIKASKVVKDWELGGVV
jgi:hypothetical protein